MCGFVGIIKKDESSVSLPLLANMAETIRYRGPDEEGFYNKGPVGFYHNRLSIIDLKTGGQPMTIGPMTIIFNGQIYNYQELRESLKAAGHVFFSTSDTEVLLRMYMQFGPDCVNHLNGMFAFLIYDRSKQRIMAARDRFGIKPLYYFEDANQWIFASEIKAIIAHPSVQAKPDYDSIKEYLVFQYVLNGDTFFKNIQKLVPGHYLLLRLDTHSAKIVKYWEPNFDIDSRHTETDFIARLKELISSAVSLRLRSDVPVGAYLSGGIDSSIVSILAAQKMSKPLKTFTGAFKEGPEFDETLFAREAARAAGARMFEVNPRERDFIELMPKLIYQMDEPMGGPGLFPQYMVSKEAAKEVKVVLGGQGGDEVFGGYTRYLIAYLEQSLKGAIYETNDEGIHIVSLSSILPNLSVIQQYVPLLRHFWEEGLFQPMDQRYFRLVDRSRGDQNAFSPDFVHQSDRERIFTRFQELFNHPKTLSYYNKMVHYDLVTNLPALLQVEDRAAMANSLESRVPLLDHRIVDLVTRIPPPMKFKGAKLKYILKKAMGDILPPKILERKDKMGFPVPLHLWARNSLHSYYKEILLSPLCRNRGIFNPGYMKKLIESEDDYGRRLWGMLNIELWFREFIDKQGTKHIQRGDPWQNKTNLKNSIRL